MASQLQIFNWSLTLLGQSRLSSPTEGANGETLSAGWEMSRDALLRRAAWTFAIQRVADVAAEATAPAHGFLYQFLLPGDVVRVLQVGDLYPTPSLSDYRTADEAPYRIEARRVLTNEPGPLNFRWIINSVAVGDYDMSFARLLAADLAEFLAPRAREDDGINKRIEAWTFKAWHEAALTNAIEDPPQEPADGPWLAAHAL